MNITKEILETQKRQLEGLRDRQVAELNVTIGKLQVVNQMILVLDAPEPEPGPEPTSIGPEQTN